MISIHCRGSLTNILFLCPKIVQTKFSGQVLSSPKTPIRAGQATPISYGVSPAQSILSPNSVASNNQGQIIITTSAPIPTLVSTTIAQPKTQQFKNIVSSVAVQQPAQIQQQQSVRIVNAPTSNVRVLSSGQTVRIASSQPTTAQVGSPIGSTTTILRQQQTTALNSTASPIVSAGKYLFIICSSFVCVFVFILDSIKNISVSYYLFGSSKSL